MFWPIKRTISEIWIFCDGGSGPLWAENGPPPHPRHSIDAGCAAAAFESGGRLLEWAWQPLPAMTNNEAEYAGLLLGIQLAQRLGGAKTICLLDSAVVVGQMLGQVRVNSPALAQWHRRADMAIRGVAHLEIRHIPREYNLLADALARQARLPWNRMQQMLDHPQSLAPISGR